MIEKEKIVTVLFILSNGGEIDYSTDRFFMYLYSL